MLEKPEAFRERSQILAWQKWDPPTSWAAATTIPDQHMARVLRVDSRKESHPWYRSIRHLNLDLHISVAVLFGAIEAVFFIEIITPLKFGALAFLQSWRTLCHQKFREHGNSQTHSRVHRAEGHHCSVRFYIGYRVVLNLTQGIYLHGKLVPKCL